MCLPQTRRRSLTLSHLSNKVDAPELKKESVAKSNHHLDQANTSKADHPISCDESGTKQGIHKKQKVVKHDYHDHSSEKESKHDVEKHISRGGVTTPFPLKLFDMLRSIEEDNMSHIVSWQPHGRCFAVHMPKLFVEEVMPKYFQQKKYASFQRQLNLYGFSRITKGCDKGGYYHELFLRGKRFLVSRIHRIKVKGTGARMASNPDAEPNFYAMEPVIDKSLNNKVSKDMKCDNYSLPKKLSQIVPRGASFEYEQKTQDKSDIIVSFEGMPLHFLERKPSNLEMLFGTQSKVFEPVPISDFGIQRPQEVFQRPSKSNYNFTEDSALLRTVSDSESDDGDNDDDSLGFLSELDKLMEFGSEPFEDDEFINFMEAHDEL